MKNIILIFALLLVAIAAYSNPITNTNILNAPVLTWDYDFIHNEVDGFNLYYYMDDNTNGWVIHYDATQTTRYLASLQFNHSYTFQLTSTYKEEESQPSNIAYYNNTNNADLYDTNGNFIYPTASQYNITNTFLKAIDISIITYPNTSIDILYNTNLSDITNWIELTNLLSDAGGNADFIDYDIYQNQKFYRVKYIPAIQDNTNPPFISISKINEYDFAGVALKFKTLPYNTATLSYNTSTNLTWMVLTNVTANQYGNVLFIDTNMNSQFRNYYIQYND